MTQKGVGETLRREKMSATAVKERFYAISVERRITNPAVLAIREAARDVTFAEDSA